MDAENMLRVGQVSSVNPANGSCRVAFDDLGGKVSQELQVVQRNTDGAKNFSLPEIGQHVLCAFLPNGTQEGFVLGSNYTASNLPEEGKPGLYRTEYSDGTVIEYDRNTHTATVRTQYHVVVVAGDVKVTAQDIQIIGNVQITGNVQIAGSLSASGSVMDGGGNTNHHSH